MLLPEHNYLALNALIKNQINTIWNAIMYKLTKRENSRHLKGLIAKYLFFDVIMVYILVS